MKSFTDQTGKAFCELRLSKCEWTHYAHLRVGLWHLLDYRPEEALLRLRAGIRALNESHGVANSETSGYHETLTRFYVWQIDKFLASKDRKRPVDELSEQLILQYGDKELPLKYWSKDRLMSREARLDWVEPDLEPLA